MSSEQTPPRRTQTERKQATIDRLVDATIGAIAEIGYSRASVGEICARSGVSKGGLFRHFDSRQSLMVAAAEEVARRHFAAVRARLDGLPDADLRTAVVLMRERHRNVDNVVWFELMVAARTDAELRERLAPSAQWFFAAITDMAAELPALAGLSPDDRHLVISTIRQLFDGEAISRTLVPEPEVESRRLDLAVRYAEFVAARGTALPGRAEP
ncbi:TetR/AcrR family transcriptional regulator [Actinocorallia longicatena]|uniref:TetR/AcrR family transcriptional regulator n=1 Tax=Actinocorallia longicatena TaxID=111803 RepID=A0ABP6QI26_9ACTN